MAAQHVPHAGPDQESAGRSHVAEIQLVGNWTLQHPHPDLVATDAADEQTTLRIRLDHGLTRELRLRRNDAP